MTEMAAAAVDLAVGAVGVATEERVSGLQVFPPKLVVRESTAAVPSAESGNSEKMGRFGAAVIGRKDWHGTGRTSVAMARRTRYRRSRGLRRQDCGLS